LARALRSGIFSVRTLASPFCERKIISLLVAFCFATAPHVASGRQSSLENGIATFVTHAYFKAGYPSDIDPARIYTYIVDYWGKGILPRSRVLAEKRSHYKRWPIRKFTLNQDTLRVSQMPSKPEFYLVEFRYFFDVSGQNGYRSGEAMTRLIVIKGGRYGFLVYAEDGKVSERF
jgi:hypothetical protein